MDRSYQCVRCGKAYSFPQRFTGKKARCKACGHVQRIAPAPDPPTPSTDPPAAGVYPLVPESPPKVATSADAFAHQQRAARRRPAKSRSWVDPVGTSIAAWRRPLRFGAGSTSRVEQESLAFLFLSIADLLVTHALLRSGPAYYESNPIAHWFFARWNIAGMTVLKFSVVALVVLIGEVVERHRPGLGKAMLAVASLMTAGVVAYGLKLLLASA